MRTPEDIQLALSVCKRNSCSKSCPYNGERACYVKLHLEAAILIRQLEHERDAAVEQLKEVDRIDLFSCSHCKNEEFSVCEFVDCENCDKDCPCATCVDMSNWQWCGVPPTD